MMEALHRGVHAFIPTAMDAIYVAIHRRFRDGDWRGARALHVRIAPELAFSNSCGALRHTGIGRPAKGSIAAGRDFGKPRNCASAKSSKRVQSARLW